MATKAEISDILATLDAPDSALPAGITQEEIDQYAKLHNAILKAQKVTKPLNDKIKAAYVEEGTFLAGNAVIERYSSSSFNSAEFLAKFPQADFPQYYVEVPATFALNPASISKDIKDGFMEKTQKLTVNIIGG